MEGKKKSCKSEIRKIVENLHYRCSRSIAFNLRLVCLALCLHSAFSLSSTSLSHLSHSRSVALTWHSIYLKLNVYFRAAKFWLSDFSNPNSKRAFLASFGSKRDNFHSGITLIHACHFSTAHTHTHTHLTQKCENAKHTHKFACLHCSFVPLIYNMI